VILVKDIIDFLENLYPKGLAYEWDNVGLQIGDANKKIKNIMISLDASTAVIDEAIENEIDLLITHHPFMFSSLKSINFSSVIGKNIQKAIKNDITIYSMHTNYDVAENGMNQNLAQTIGLNDIQPFSMIDEVHGLGRIGELDQPMDIEELSNLLYEKLAPHVGFISNVEANNITDIRYVAVIGGSGGKYIQDAIDAKADVLVTGDITYHTAMEALDLGLTILDIGHYAEVIMEKHIQGLLANNFKDEINVITPGGLRNPII